ncbi:hypothetical protein J4E91_006192 [Alternaria rosae]|nr:hypothetical protein J4E91_006192 [Alternaria rosae]
MTTRTPPLKRKAEKSDIAPEPKKLRRSVAERPSFQSDSITVIVGRLSKAFTVDKKLLRTSCSFFDDQPHEKKDMNAGPKEVRLQDITGRAFEIYRGWLQTGCFYIVDEDDDSHPPDDEPADHSDKDYMNPSEVEREKWYECYMLGHKIRDVGFQDACVDLVKETITSGSDNMMVVATRLYKTNGTNSVHREFAVAIAAHLWKPEIFAYVPHFNYPKLFVEDLVAYMGPKMRRKQLSVEEPVATIFKNADCKYHAHVWLKKPCYKETHPAFK